MVMVGAIARGVRVTVNPLQGARLAEAALRAGVALGPDYTRAMRLWFILAWPALLGLLAIFWLMVTRPALW
jgi:uncharacterized membrane protein